MHNNIKAMAVPSVFRVLQLVFSLRPAAVPSQSACNEKPISPSVEEETPLPSSDKGGHMHTDKKDIA
jgi:hypothetical protein